MGSRRGWQAGRGRAARDYPVNAALPIQRRRFFYTLFEYRLGPPNSILWQDIPTMPLRSLEGYPFLILATWKALWGPYISGLAHVMLAIEEALQRGAVLTVAVTPEPHELPAGPLVDKASQI
jgi:hypothetical protein